MKGLPLSAVMTLLAAGNAFGAVNSGFIAVVNEEGKASVINVAKYKSDSGYRKDLLAQLRTDWVHHNSIFYSEDGNGFLDFSKNAGFGKSFANSLSDAKKNGILNVDIINDSIDDLPYWNYN